MSDLFDWRDKYPKSPGFKVTDTSREAAQKMQPKAINMRLDCLEALQGEGAMTADEIASLLHESILAIRPRITELNKMGLIKDTGERRKNASGRNAIVWRAA